MSDLRERIEAHTHKYPSDLLAKAIQELYEIGNVQAIANQAAEEIKVLKPEPGDIVAVKVGITDMGDGLPPWIPSPDELRYIYDDLQIILPKDVKVIVSHMGLNYEIIRDAELADAVQVTSIPRDDA